MTDDNESEHSKENASTKEEVEEKSGRIKVLNICMECAKKCKYKIKNELKRIEKRLELPKIACGIQITDNIIMYEVERVIVETPGCFVEFFVPS